MLFAAIIGTAAAWAVQLTIMLVMVVVFAVLGNVVDEGPPPELVAFMPLQMLPGMVLAPFQILLGLFINTAVLHVCLMILKLGKKGFESTFRTVCYAGAVQALMLIPILGWFVAPIWGIVVTIIGLREVNNTTTGKATLAFFMPWVFICCVVLLVYAAIVAIAMTVFAAGAA